MRYLINKINSDLNAKLGLQKEEFKLTGVLILFNNLLHIRRVILFY